MDLKQPLKRGTMVRFNDKNLRVHFKYEKLPTFRFVCGRLGHKIKDYEACLNWGKNDIGIWMNMSYHVACGSGLHPCRNFLRKKEKGLRLRFIL